MKDLYTQKNVITRFQDHENKWRLLCQADLSGPLAPKGHSCWAVSHNHTNILQPNVISQS